MSESNRLRRDRSRPDSNRTNATEGKGQGNTLGYLRSCLAGGERAAKMASHGQRSMEQRMPGRGGYECPTTTRRCSGNSPGAHRRARNTPLWDPLSLQLPAGPSAAAEPHVGRWLPSSRPGLVPRAVSSGCGPSTAVTLRMAKPKPAFEFLLAAASNVDHRAQVGFAGRAHACQTDSRTTISSTLQLCLTRPEQDQTASP